MARYWLRVSFVFFFQAEDGIRDFHVTGVQTCALPILRGSSTRASLTCRFSDRSQGTCRRTSQDSNSSSLRAPVFPGPPQTYSNPCWNETERNLIEISLSSTPPSELTTVMQGSGSETFQKSWEELTTSQLS